MKNLDLNKLRKEINKEKSTGVLELKLPDQLEAIEDVKKSIDNLSGLLEGQEQYDFDQLKQAIDEVKNLLQTIDFAPFIKSLEESINNVLTLHNSTHKELQNKNNEAISRLTKTIVDNKPVVNVKANTVPATEYRPSDSDIFGIDVYFGFLHPTGKWYILKQSGKEQASFRYATGLSNYSQNWSVHKRLTYKPFSEVKL